MMPIKAVSIQWLSKHYDEIEEEPGFFQIEEGHISRCWLCESGQLKTDHVEKAGD
jgi:hypothetical protein